MSIPTDKEWAEKSATRIQACADEHYSMSDGEPDTIVRDMLADLRHYCDAKGINFGEASVRAEDYYHDEVKAAEAE